MSEISIVFSWITSLTKIGVFGALFAFSIVLVRVSKLKELKFFALASLSFMLSSLFELMNTISYLDDNFGIIEKNNAMVLAKIFLLVSAAFLFLFLQQVNKNIKNYL